MLVQVLSAIHNITIMLFGIFCSAFFLGVKPRRKNILALFLLFCGQGSLYIIDFLIFGETLANQSYPLIVHFPLILFLTFYYKYPLISSAVSVFSAYLCCQVSKLDGIIRSTNDRSPMVLLYCKNPDYTCHIYPSVQICIPLHPDTLFQRAKITLHHRFSAFCLLYF